MNDSANNYCVNMVEIGKRIRALRRSKGLTIQQLEDFFAITPQALYKWERGDSIPEVQNLVALSRLLGVSIDTLLLGDSYPIAA